MLPEEPYGHPVSSFEQPISVPADDPGAGTLMSVCFAQAWLPLILGCLAQLLQESTWDTSDPAIMALAQDRAMTLQDMFMQGWCEMTTGMITLYAGSTPPDGWLICDGSPVSRTCYAALFATLGTKFGAGDGSTTFNLPDLGGRVPIGVGAQSGGTTFALGDHGGEEKHQLTTPELASHNHADSGHAHTYGGTLALVALTGEEPVSIPNPLPATTGTGYANISNTGGDTAHNNLQPYLALLPIIKI